MDKKLKIFQCPGKVLLMGGYSILYQNQHSISLGISAKFYARVQSMFDVEGSLNFIFYSKQFQETWQYKYEQLEGVIHQILGPSNAYLYAICKIFSKYIQNMEPRTFYVQYASDGEFYSNQLMDLSHIKKTGLGSSSALIVSCIGALLDNIGVDDLKIFYELCLSTNHFAQNKIGSGFDISTSILGSQIYMRPSINSYKPLCNQVIKLGQDFRILMIDLNEGQSTIQSVGKVTQYLGQNQKELEFFLQQSEVYYAQILDCFDQLQNGLNKWQCGIVEINKNYRKLMKDLGVRAKTEIEPDIVTYILDRLVEGHNDIVYGISPGAGGYDAIMLLLYQKEQLIDIEKYQIDLNHIAFNFHQQIDNHKPSLLNIFELNIDNRGFCELDPNDQIYNKIILNF